jgi:UDP-2,3-diacylglucosamine pyrophosphatase LpxH
LKKSVFRNFQKNSQILIFIQYLVQKIEKYVKIHVLGDFGDIWIGISENFQKIDFSSNLTENLIP